MKLPPYLLAKPVSSLIAALCLLTAAPASTEVEARAVIEDTFKHNSDKREPGKPLSGTTTEKGDAVWSASDAIVFGNEGVTMMGQSNEWASFPFSPSAMGLDRRPFALRVKIRFAKASNLLWLGFGKGKRLGCMVILNAKEQTWKISNGEKDEVRKGDCTWNGDVNVIELRIDPHGSTCELVVNEQKVAENVPLFVDPATYTMVNFRFFFLSRFEMTAVEVLAL